MDIAKKIDHTLLKPTCHESDIIRLCEEAIQFCFYSVCIPPFYVHTAKSLLKKQIPKVCTVIGFPLGYDTLNTKIAAVEEALSLGADEIDMVVNLTAFKTGKIQAIYSEVEKLAELTHKNSSLLKVIIETAYLNKDEMRMLCGICVDAGTDFIKTSTGFADKGATLEDILFLREILPLNNKIKASGGIKTYKDAISFIKAGADRLGTSNSLAIIEQENLEQPVLNN